MPHFSKVKKAIDLMIVMQDEAEPKESDQMVKSEIELSHHS
jgi:hypothetical protein